MAQIIPFPHVDGAGASSSTTLGMSSEEIREVSWTNFYANERRRGTPPDLAYQRTEEHVQYLDNLRRIGHIMSEVG